MWRLAGLCVTAVERYLLRVAPTKTVGDGATVAVGAGAVGAVGVAGAADAAVENLQLKSSLLSTSAHACHLL